jgi:tryptophan halogenase
MTLELQSRWLLYCMPSTDFEEPLAEQYNQSVNRLYDEIRDFLGMHFSLSERKGPFWDAVRNDAKKSDALQYHLDLWKYALPAPSDPRSKTVYNHWSVLSVLMGKNFYKNSSLAGSELVPLPMWARYGVETRAWKEPILGRLAQHNRLINHMHDQAVPGESVRKKDTGDETLFSDIEMLSTPAPIMAPPPGTRGRAPARPASAPRRP